MRSCYATVLFAVFAVMLLSCKKETTASVSIVGKWYNTRQSSQTLNNGKVLSSFTINKYTTDDFAQFFSDGSGYFSESVYKSPTIIQFNYVLSGTALKIYTSSVSGGKPATITNLAANNLSIHIEALVPDQNNPDQADNEIDDYDYVKGN